MRRGERNVFDLFCRVNDGNMQQQGVKNTKYESKYGKKV